MKRRWKITFGILGPLLVLWLAEPYIKEWYYREECSFGSVSKDEYAEIKDRAKEIFRNWDWSKRVPPKPRGSIGSISASYAPYLTAFLDANLVKFIPEKATTDVKIAHVLAFMEGIGARMYYKHAPNSYKDKNTVIYINYVIYKLKLGRYNPILLLAPKSRFLKIFLELQESYSEYSIVKRVEPWPTGFLVIPLDDGLRWQTFKPLGCVEEGLFKSWELTW
jgi:hypothetical protein